MPFPARAPVIRLKKNVPLDVECRQSSQQHQKQEKNGNSNLHTIVQAESNHGSCRAVAYKPVCAATGQDGCRYTKARGAVIAWPAPEAPGKPPPRSRYHIRPV